MSADPRLAAKRYLVLGAEADRQRPEASSPPHLTAGTIGVPGRTIGTALRVEPVALEGGGFMRPYLPRGHLRPPPCQAGTRTAVPWLLSMM